MRLLMVSTSLRRWKNLVLQAFPQS